MAEGNITALLLRERRVGIQELLFTRNFYLFLFFQGALTWKNTRCNAQTHLLAMYM